MNQLREHWSSSLGFVLAAIGSAIGLGILWKFPYTIGENGGGLFLLMYLVCLIVVGVPLFIGELILGRGSQRAAVNSFDHLDVKGKRWRVAGWLGVIASFLIMSFYSVIAGWGMSYVLMSLGGFYKGLDAHEISNVFDKLSHSGSISTFWHFMFTLLTMGIVYSGVRKGIEFWSKIMVRILFVLLLILFFYAISLEGFSKAVHFIFYPDLERFKPSSIIEALGLAFWTLSIGQGIMISYGSYMKKDENIIKLASIVAGSVIVVAILAALMIFPVVFTFDLPAKAGPGLIFKTLPYLFAQLPAPMVLSTLFFALFVFTALTSAIPLIEVVATNLMEVFKISRPKAVTYVGIATFIFGIPSAYALTDSIFINWTAIFGMDFLTTINQIVSIWIIPFAGLLTAIFIGWRLDFALCKKEFLSGDAPHYLFRPWYFFIKWVVPLVVLLIVAQTSGLINIDRWVK